ncbi:hypothetical protein GCM10010304_64880 [Streptomyces roseoviolaceus]
MSLGEFAALLLQDFVVNVGPLGAAVAVMSTCWPYYTLARRRHAFVGRLPWRLQACLAEAHRLGVLRQVGAVYQFRSRCCRTNWRARNPTRRCRLPGSAMHEAPPTHRPPAQVGSRTADRRRLRDTPHPENGTGAFADAEDCLLS